MSGADHPTQGRATLSTEEAESLLRVTAMVGGLWKDRGAARRFLNAPHPELNGRTPLELAMTDAGARQVEEVIERGRHGLPA